MAEKQEQAPHEIWLVINKLLDKNTLALVGELSVYEIEDDPQNGYPSVQSQISIIIDLFNKGAIKLIQKSFGQKGTEIFEDVPSTRKSGKAKGIYFEIQEPKFGELYDEYSKYKNHSTIAPKNNEYWIVKDESGDYWFESTKVYFKNPKAQYVKIFVAVFSLIPHGGSIEYEKITDIYEPATKENVQRALTIKDASLLNLVDAFKRVHRDGIKLFEAASDGSVLFFYNMR